MAYFGTAHITSKACILGCDTPPVKLSGIACQSQIVAPLRTRDYNSVALRADCIVAPLWTGDRAQRRFQKTDKVQVRCFLCTRNIKRRTKWRLFCTSFLVQSAGALLHRLPPQKWDYEVRCWWAVAQSRN